MHECEFGDRWGYTPFHVATRKRRGRFPWEVALKCHSSLELVEDIYPCSPLQVGLMALSIKQPGLYIAQDVVRLSEATDLVRFQASWNAVVASHPVLRTRIVQTNLGMFQAVLREQPQWQFSDDLQQYLEEQRNTSIELGAPLLHFAIINGSKSRQFIWTIHHSIYDGWSLSLILDQVQQCYEGVKLDTSMSSYKRFIKHLGDSNAEDSNRFWSSGLSGATSISFPRLPSATHRPCPSASTEYEVSCIENMQSGITTSTLLRVAWAILISRHTDAPDVTFGATVSGRDTAMLAIDEIIGPTIATVPIRIKLANAVLVKELLQETQQHAVQMIPFQHIGLSSIARLSRDARSACSFQTLLLTQPRQRKKAKSTSVLSMGDSDPSRDLSPFNIYALMIQCELEENRVKFLANFDPAVIEGQQMHRILRQFGHVLDQLSNSHLEKLVGQVQVISSVDSSEIFSWNNALPLAVNQCVHRIIERQAATWPNRDAICSWDGKLTYGELNKLSSQLAVHLESNGVGPESLVPLCFEKSLWATVSMLGILKAGGACVCLDPNHPCDRHQAILREINASFILVSPTQEEKLKNLVQERLIVDSSFLGSCEETDYDNRVSPENVAFVIFTSGSTGTPKGIVIEHSTISTGAVAFGEALHLGSDSRVLQFSAYTFDVGIFDNFATLIRGGCVCVPSEYERTNDIVGAMKSMRANWAYLTPSFLRTVDPREELPLTTLVLGGEAVGQDNIDKWADKVELMNGYGPTEASISICGNIPDRSHDIATLGRPTGCVCWIVECEDHNRLAPIGGIGELVVEGPVVARGYLNDSQETDEVFIKNPSWKPAYRSCDRFYKTGDLAAYNADGTIRYLGRRDTQIKIHGQRVELGEIEYQLRQRLPLDVKVITDVVPSASHDNLTLAAFLESKSGFELDESWLSFTEDLNQHLLATLPPHMVPTMFVPLPQLPYTSSGKIDRLSLKRFASQLSIEDRKAYSLVQAQKRALTSVMEVQLRTFWARVLDINDNEIGADDNFLRIGGDSIAAIRLAAIARTNGINLIVSDIFSHPKLSSMSLRCTESQSDEDIATFSLLRTHDRAGLLAEVASRCQTDGALIEDVYPCTPLQEGLIARLLMVQTVQFES